MTRSGVQMRYLSMGWGVQSWTIAAMMALDELPRVDYVIHSDTGHERQATYEFAATWTPWLAERGVHVTTVGADKTDIVRPDWGDGSSVMIPAFTLGKADGHRGQVPRQCTRYWKIVPLRQFVRQRMALRGIKRAPGVIECWMGISSDEWMRMRTSDVRYIDNVYPLVDRGITRNDCMEWLSRRGLPIPPKSSCTFCPYHSLAAWKELKAGGGSDWAEAVAVDESIRDRANLHRRYVHPHRKPLEEAVVLPEDGVLDRELGLEQPCDSGHCWT